MNHDTNATAHDATPPPGASDALAIRAESILAQMRNFLENTNSLQEFDTFETGSMWRLIRELSRIIDAQTELAAATTAYKDTHHYSDEYVEALHRELVPSTETRVMTSGTTQDTTMVPFMPDATAPTRETPAPLGDTGTLLTKEVYPRQPVDGYTFTAAVHGFEPFIVTGIERAKTRDGYILHNPDYPNGVGVSPYLPLTYKRDATPPAPGALAAATKLTPALRKTLAIAVNRGDNGTWSKRQARLQELHKLEALGYVEPIDSEPDWNYPMGAAHVCYIPTDLGRRALADATPDGGER